MPEQRPHPREHVERWLAWYGRASLVLLGLLVVGLGGPRGRFLIPPLVLWYWHVARSSSTSWRLVLAVMGGFLAADALWFMAGPGGPGLVALAVVLGALAGVLIARAPARPPLRSVTK